MKGVFPGLKTGAANTFVFYLREINEFISAAHLLQTKCTLHAALGSGVTGSLT